MLISYLSEAPITEEGNAILTRLVGVHMGCGLAVSRAQRALNETRRPGLPEMGHPDYATCLVDTPTEMSKLERAARDGLAGSHPGSPFDRDAWLEWDRLVGAGRRKFRTSRLDGRYRDLAPQERQPAQQRAGKVPGPRSGRPA